MKTLLCILLFVSAAIAQTPATPATPVKPAHKAIMPTDRWNVSASKVSAAELSLYLIGDGTKANPGKGFKLVPVSPTPTRTPDASTKDGQAEAGIAKACFVAKYYDGIRYITLCVAKDPLTTPLASNTLVSLQMRRAEKDVNGKLKPL